MSRMCAMVPAANEYRPRERAACCAADDSEVGECFDARHHFRHQEPSARRAEDAPADLNIRLLADQSLFVRGSIQVWCRSDYCRVPHRIHDPGVPGELAQHGDHCSFDSAVDSDVDHLPERAGETINIMTLAGWRWRLHSGRRRHGGNREHQPQPGHGQGSGARNSGRRAADCRSAFVSTLSICIVFVPMFFLTGVARYLFVPLAEAVSFAMLASYFLSRTVVPTMAKYLLRGHEAEAGHASKTSRNPFVRMQIRFEEAFERFRERYHGLLQSCCIIKDFSDRLLRRVRAVAVFLVRGWGRISFRGG